MPPHKRNNALSTTLVATVVFLCAPLRAQDFPDAVSRAVGVYNDLTEIGDAVSRAVAVQNDLTDADFMTDAISRAIGIQNDLLSLTDINDAISRALSAHNSFRCLGSFNDDGVVTMADVPSFVNTLIGVIDDPFYQEAADLNCDGQADGQDVAPFVTELLNS